MQKRLPRLVHECAVRWDLRLEDPFPDAYVSHVVPAGDRVLKIQWPHHESEHEADALERWGGAGLVIDPKPLVGEREFGLAPIIRSFELGHGGRGGHRAPRLPQLRARARPRACPPVGARTDDCVGLQ